MSTIEELRGLAEIYEGKGTQTLMRQAADELEAAQKEITVCQQNSAYREEQWSKKAHKLEAELEAAQSKCAELELKHSNQAAWILSYQKCLDGLGLIIPGALEGHLMPDDIRRALEAAQKRVSSLEQALKGIKLYALTTNQPGHLVLAHIVRLCINAGVTQKLDALQSTP